MRKVFWMGGGGGGRGGGGGEGGEGRVYRGHRQHNVQVGLDVGHEDVVEVAEGGLADIPGPRLRDDTQGETVPN